MQQRADNRIAKFMARYDALYAIIKAWPDTLFYTLGLPQSSFHASLLLLVNSNGSLTASSIGANTVAVTNISCADAAMAPSTTSGC
ncbi:uncharacterized protein PHACADRAFT_247664 [Phanerochaete carnosa HHB-10118-sp]|uniref:Uncharacterized protein n=1 Tax=Phanerochaete carnosa (strain HHB-10118-sp) TaxID=650164 RepID=K5WP22_PHACS|nr:uncharacterized protein PHACADRAFT_247664 [Phanerochaete carnosa HHB-10118-sp]EKM61205.1 hypothetical protein PHACADRAFT_247664 [Phanerochaete carnosa HHB-10118-sp]